MKILKIRDVKTPVRANSTDAGIDFFIPKFDDEFRKEFTKLNPDLFLLYAIKQVFYIQSNERVLIPSGIKVNIPDGYALLSRDKSGVAYKKGLSLMAGVIDQTYQGEIGILIYNTTYDEIKIESGEKIAQFLLVPILYDTIEEVKNLKELYPEGDTERAEGGYGSTGNK